MFVREVRCGLLSAVTVLVLLDFARKIVLEFSHVCWTNLRCMCPKQPGTKRWLVSVCQKDR